MPRLTGLDHLVLTVTDLDRTIRFYHEVLGMTAERFQVADGSQRTALKFGSQKINLHLSGAEFAPHAAAPKPGSADLCFVTETPLEEWLALLAEKQIPVIDGPVDRTGARGRIQSIYLRDPDGNLLEISVYL